MIDFIILKRRLNIGFMIIGFLVVNRVCSEFYSKVMRMLKMISMVKLKRIVMIGWIRLCM